LFVVFFILSKYAENSVFGYSERTKSVPVPNEQKAPPNIMQQAIISKHTQSCIAGFSSAYHAFVP
jgi:hypothetical protein